MTDFQHHFETPEEYLHHRRPYLMVDRIIEIGERHIRTEKVITGNEFFLPGHFPGAPIMPGAMLQEFATQSAGILIAARFNPLPQFDTSDPHFNAQALGVLVKIRHARFKRFGRPGDCLVATVELQEREGNLFDFSARVTCDSETLLVMAFQLMNIPSALLHETRAASV